MELLPCAKNFVGSTLPRDVHLTDRTGRACQLLPHRSVSSTKKSPSTTAPTSAIPIAAPMARCALSRACSASARRARPSPFALRKTRAWEGAPKLRCVSVFSGALEGPENEESRAHMYVALLCKFLS